MHSIIKVALGVGVAAGVALSYLPSRRAAASTLAAPSAVATTSSSPSSSAYAHLASSVDEAAPARGEPCRGVVVAAIAQLEDDEKSMAAVRNEKGLGAVVTKGSIIANRRVVHVGSERVWLLGAGGDVCFAEIFHPVSIGSPEASKPEAPRPPGWFKPYIVRKGPGEFDVDRALIEKVMESREFTRMRGRPENGALGLYGISEASLLGQLGFQNGDRLKTINGVDVTDPQRALELYARLSSLSKIVANVERGGQNVTLDYELR